MFVVVPLNETMSDAITRTPFTIPNSTLCCSPLKFGNKKVFSPKRDESYHHLLFP
jgi:hypothetical protein